MIERIDELILSNVTKRWQKVALIVATVLLEGDDELSDSNDEAVVNRLKALVFEGKLEAQGDLDQMRYCEIRII